MQWNAKTKRTVSAIVNALSGVALLGWYSFSSISLFGTITLATILGLYQLYNAWMVYRNEY